VTVPVVPRLHGWAKDPSLPHQRRSLQSRKARDTEKSRWETLERRTHTDKQRLAGRVADLLKADQKAEAVDLLDTWTANTANAQFGVVACEDRQ
jgi:hypothetical protein